ncbi:MAG: PTS transporter subunit EIIB, partial [Enterococcus sp.]|nr:PTS transporter subunit EIIB [Enterococcus sp.]
MKKDAKKTASELLTLFEGKDNIASVTHCATRLR